MNQNKPKSNPNNVNLKSTDIFKNDGTIDFDNIVSVLFNSNDTNDMIHDGKHTGFKRSRSVIDFKKQEIKKRKSNSWTSNQIFSNQLIEHIFSFVCDQTNNYQPYNLVCMHWNTALKQLFKNATTKEIQFVSNSFFKNDIFWSNHEIVKNVKRLIKQKKPKEVMDALKKVIPLKKYLADVKEPETYYASGIVEYMLLKYGDDSVSKKKNIQIETGMNYCEHVKYMVYSILEQKQYALLCGLADEFLKKYNPAYIFVRFEQIESLKAQKMMNDMFHKTLECFKICQTPENVAKCYRNFGFYFIEYHEIDMAMACLLKSAQYNVHPSICHEISHILKKSIKIKMDSLKKDDPDFRIKTKRLKLLKQFCKLMNQKLANFMCDNNITTFSRKLHRFFPRNEIPYLINCEQTNESRLPNMMPNFTGRNHIEDGRAQEDDLIHVENQSVQKPKKRKIVNYKDETIIPPPSYQFTQDELLFINQTLKNFCPVTEHIRSDIEYRVPHVNQKLIFIYNTLYDICKQNEQEKAFEIHQSKLDRSFQDKNYVKTKGLGLLWKDCGNGFITSQQLKWILEIFNKNKTPQHIECMNQHKLIHRILKSQQEKINLWDFVYSNESLTK